MPEDILDNLTEPQREAVTHIDGPMLVVAGAGSGKTRVVTRRIAHLIRSGVRPHQILAMTFTNKAAGEMKERVAALVGETPRWVGTFHSICARLLRYDLEKLGDGRNGGFSIIDTDDQQSLMRQFIKDRNLTEDSRFKPRTLSDRISRAKSDLIDPDNYGEGKYEDEIIANIYRDYEKYLRKTNAVDFDDLLILTVRMLEKVPGLKEVYHDRFKYLLIDEYQDTNRTQYKLMRLLTSDAHNVHVTGDPDQSIYSWRGADYRNIMDFKKDFPEARVVRLEQNYRSTKNILAAANAVIRNNSERIDKDLFTENDAGEKIHAACLESDRDEANWILGRIRDIRAVGAPLNDMAIFYRTNAQSRALEEAFLSAGTPYQIVGGVRFYQRREVKDLLAHLKILVNPRDIVSLSRIVGCRPTGVGEKTLQGIIEQAERIGGGTEENATARLDGMDGANSSPFLFLCRPDFDKVYSGRKNQKLKDFAKWCRQLNDTPRKPVSEAVRNVLHVSGLCEYLILSEPESADERIDNMKSLLQRAEEFAYANPDADLAAFLEDVALVADIDSFDENADTVTLMTLHSAKGLEFPYVFIAGMEQGLLPHENSQNSNFQLEEERRLFYVGLTRAEKQAFLTHACSRFTHGRFAMNAPSPFLGEIPMQLLDVQMMAQPRQRAVFGDNDGLDFDPFGDDDWGDPFGDQKSSFKRYAKPQFGRRSGSSFGSSGGAAAKSTTGAKQPFRKSISFDPDADGMPDDIDDDMLFGDDAPTSAESSPFADDFDAPPATAAPRGGSPKTFRTGDLVLHPTFGKGKILSASNSKVIVQFFIGGVKSLSTAQSRLTRL